MRHIYATLTIDGTGVLSVFEYESTHETVAMRTILILKTSPPFFEKRKEEGEGDED